MTMRQSLNEMRNVDLTCILKTPSHVRCLFACHLPHRGGFEWRARCSTSIWWLSLFHPWWLSPFHPCHLFTPTSIWWLSPFHPRRVFPSTASNGYSAVIFATMRVTHRDSYAAKALLVLRRRWSLRTRLSPRGKLRRRLPKAIPSRGPWLADGFCCPVGSALTMTSSAPLPSTRQFMDSLSSLPTRVGGTREGPQFTRHVCSCVPSPGPRWTGRLQSAVASPTVLAFAISAVARHPHCHASWFTRGLCNGADRFTCATARTVASPSPTKDVYDRAFAGWVTPIQRRL